MSIQRPEQPGFPPLDPRMIARIMNDPGAASNVHQFPRQPRIVRDPPPFLVAEMRRRNAEFDRTGNCPAWLSKACAIFSIYVAVIVVSYFVAALVSGAGQ